MNGRIVRPTEAFVFHFTKGIHLPQILSEGVLRPSYSAQGNPNDPRDQAFARCHNPAAVAERPAVWCTLPSVDWEPTVWMQGGRTRAF